MQQGSSGSACEPISKTRPYWRKCAAISSGSEAVGDGEGGPEDGYRFSRGLFIPQSLVVGFPERSAARNRHRQEDIIGKKTSYARRRHRQEDVIGKKTSYARRRHRQEDVIGKKTS